MFRASNFNAGNSKSVNGISKLNRGQLTSEDRRLTKVNLHLDPNNNIRNRKFGNPAKLHELAISETTASFQIPNRSRSRSNERNTGYGSNLSKRSAKKKHVTFKDQNNTLYQLEDPINTRSNRIVVKDNPQPTPILKRKESQKQLLYIVSGFTALETPNSPAPAVNEFVSPSELRSSDPNGCLFTVDMSGFHSHNLAFYIKGTRLIIEGIRPMKLPFISSRRTQEIVQLPPGVQGDNLKVARNEDGILLVEEAWQF